MRSIRITTGIVLVAAVGAVLLSVGLAMESAVTSHARQSTREALRAQARLISTLADSSHEDPAALAERMIAGTAERATVFTADGEVLADRSIATGGAATRPSTRDLWRSIVSNAEHGKLLHAGAWLPDGSILLLTAEADPALAARRSMRTFLLATFIALALLAALVAAWGWASLDQTIRRIEAVAERLRRGEMTARVRDVRPGAVWELTGAVNASLDEIGRRLGEATAQGRYYAAILDQMTDAVVAIDDRNRVRFINRPFAHLFDVTPDQAVGRPLESATLNYDVSTLVGRAVQQRSVQRDRITLTHPEEYLLEGVATPLIDDDGHVIGAVALLHDITQLREASRIRQEFVANASHELRTPAAGIKALAEALQAGAINDPERGPRFLEQIVDAADRLSEILDDMLTLTRVERGAPMIEPRTIDAATALEHAADQVRPTAEQKGVTVRTECGEGEQVHADPASLQTLLLNLLDNAVKYTPAGGEVAARGRPVPGGYEFAVTDTGVGIPQQHLGRIFERFYRVDRARDRATGSTGLGLSIVRHIAEAHGGGVKVSSREGEGSTFTAVFPDRQVR
ncbi:MAG: sensor histidine kinase [Armatimonadota bacterium]|jgi:two-component system phosphate regulon sensor histidine kinase PhoR